jgi:hypothetical protein
MTDTMRRWFVPAVRLAAVAISLAVAPVARAAQGVIVSGSVYVDYWGIPDQELATKAPQGVAHDASLKVQVDINDDLAFSAKVCSSCHGLEMEHLYLDFMPSSAFNVQLGRLMIPFGDYPQRLDPSSHKSASAPLIYDMGRMPYLGRTGMNLGVVPAPYTDTGAMVYGVTWLGESIQVWYGAYGVAGLRGQNDVDWIAMRSGSYQDQNREPAGGGRVAVTFSAEPGSFFGDASVGGSFTAGRYDREAQLAYVMWGADATLRAGPFTLRGEYAARTTDLDPNASYRYDLVDTWFKKEGWYGELEHPLGKYLGLVYRYDELRRAGVPLPGSTAELSADSRMVRYTAGVQITPAQAIYVKTGWEYWETTDFGDFHSWHVGIGGAF